MITKISDESQFYEILDHEEVFVVKFTASWCGPCKLNQPAYERLAEKTKEINFYVLDIDELSEIGDQYEITAVPSFVVFKNQTNLPKHEGPTGFGAYIRTSVKTQKRKRGTRKTTS